MRDRGRGHITNVASECGLIPIPSLGEYTAAKYGIVGMTEVLRRELADTGVKVSVVCPGPTRSNMTVGIGMEASFVGEAIVSGIERDEFYILTHPGIEPAVRRRFEEILAAFAEPAQPGYVQPASQWQ
jgi:short-subunit dehydrogenase